ncbi:MAG: DUF1987 domain-containing protein [Leptospiraceae bacterium]|nr:DUF1987 domain-containing protein [Leptospiraceae bacterium]
MDKILIKKTKVSPEVVLEPDGFAEISGESYPENSVSFYEPIMKWLKEAVDEKKEINFNFRLDYFNTSSSKCIMDILSKLDKYNTDGGKVVVKWHYAEDDDDMLEAGEDFSADLSLPFEKIAT